MKTRQWTGLALVASALIGCSANTSTTTQAPTDSPPVPEPVSVDSEVTQTTENGHTLYTLPAGEAARAESGVFFWEVAVPGDGTAFVRALDADRQLIASIHAATQTGEESARVTMVSGDTTVVADLVGDQVHVIEINGVRGTADAVLEQLAPDQLEDVQLGARAFTHLEADAERLQEVRLDSCVIPCITSTVGAITGSATCIGVAIVCAGATTATVGGTAVPCWLAISLACGGAAAAVTSAIYNCSKCNQCQPITCQQMQGVCGYQYNGCGTQIWCNCQPGLECTAQQLCRQPCQPKTCSANYPGQCGYFDNGCGGELTCICTNGETCDNGTCREPDPCGDGYCDWDEDSYNCQQDCGAPGYCGDGDCNYYAYEDEYNCWDDCGSSGWCGDGYCDYYAYEDEYSCSSDCGGGWDPGGGGDCSDSFYPPWCPYYCSDVAME